MQDTWVPSLGQEDPLEKGMAIHSSILAWRIPWTEETWQATVHTAAKSQTRLSNLHFYTRDSANTGFSMESLSLTHTHIPLHTHTHTSTHPPPHTPNCTLSELHMTASLYSHSLGKKEERTAQKPSLLLLFPFPCPYICSK